MLGKVRDEIQTAIYRPDEPNIMTAMTYDRIDDLNYFKMIY